MFGSKNSKRIGFSECHERNMPRTFKNRLNVTIEELVNLLHKKYEKLHYEKDKFNRKQNGFSRK
jgi:hypothetical protein